MKTVSYSIHSPPQRDGDGERAVIKTGCTSVFYRLLELKRGRELKMNPKGEYKRCTLSMPRLDDTRLFISLTAGAGTRSMSLLLPTSNPLCSSTPA